MTEANGKHGLNSNTIKALATVIALVAGAVAAYFGGMMGKADDGRVDNLENEVSQVEERVRETELEIRANEEKYKNIIFRLENIQEEIEELNGSL